MENNFILFNKKWDFFSHSEMDLNNSHKPKSGWTMHRCDVKLQY